MVKVPGGPAIFEGPPSLTTLDDEAPGRAEAATAIFSN